jgi:hypothetical protein
MVIADRFVLNGQADYDPYEVESKRDQPPSAEYVRDLFTAYRNYYKDFHYQCATAEDYYFGRNVVPAPEGFEPVKPAKARSIINTATDHVDVNNIEIDVPSGNRSKSRAEKIKKFYQGAWLAIKGPVLRTAVKHTFLYGIAWLKPMFRPDQWPDAPHSENYMTNGDLDEEAYRTALKDFMDDRCVKFPLTVHNVNPKNIVWDDSRAEKQWCIEYYEREARDVRRRYPEWISARPTRPS